MNPSPDTHLLPCVLIVDDEEGPRQSLKFIFSKIADVQVASSGREALEIAAEWPVDVAFLDIRMPDLSGIDVLRELKAIDQTTEVVMLTAFETIETAKQALRLGAFNYLNKPYDVKEVRSNFQNAWQRRAASSSTRHNLSQLETLKQEIEKQSATLELNREKDQIYATILHDINGPLSIISAFIQIMERQLKEAQSMDSDRLEKLKGQLGRVNTQANHCIEISKRYLSYFRNEAQRTTRLPIHQMLADIQILLEKHPSAINHTVTVNPNDTGIAAAVDATELMQVILNLAINALQSSTKSHTVNITAYLVDEPIATDEYPDGPGCVLINREAFQNQAPLAAISVQDTGPGIAPEDFHRIFDPYFTTKQDSGGTGLGLPTVARVVKAAKGAMLVRSVPGEGTEFSLFLPVER